MMSGDVVDAGLQTHGQRTRSPRLDVRAAKREGNYLVSDAVSIQPIFPSARL